MQAPISGRVPPHLAAQQASNDVEVYEVEPQIIGGPADRGKKPLDNAAKEHLNKTSQASKNPNWVPPRKG